MIMHGLSNQYNNNKQTTYNLTTLTRTYNFNDIDDNNGNDNDNDFAS